MWINKGVLVGIGLFLMRMLVGLVPAFGHFEPAPIPSSWASVTWWWQTLVTLAICIGIGCVIMRFWPKKRTTPAEPNSQK